MSDTPQDLVDAATAVRENAVAPYSGFKVGSALRTDKGTVYAGCNVENATLGLTVCAERVALWKALSEGERTLHRDRRGYRGGKTHATLRRVSTTTLGVLWRH